MTGGQVNFGSWIFRVLAWDGILPVCVMLVPTLIKFLFPNNRGALELAGVVTPAILFVARLIVGKRHIAANHCSATVQHIQLCFFYFGILVLGFVEGVLILSHLMPKGAFMFANKTDWVVWLILFSVYLTVMTVAMYPGRVDAPDDTVWPEEFGDVEEM